MRFLAEPYPKRSVRILFALPYPILGVSYFPYPKIGYVGPLGGDARLPECHVTRLREEPKQNFLLAAVSWVVQGSAVPEEGLRGRCAGNLPERKIGQLPCPDGGPHGQLDY